jgi:hypothetical protein
VWIWLADAVAAVHFAYLIYIPTGGLLAIRWPRMVWPHLAAVAIGFVSITIGFDCPLTTWEQSLRRHGGQTPYSNGFVAHYLTGHVYPHGYAWAVQVVFGVCVVLSYAIVIRRRRVRRLRAPRPEMRDRRSPGPARP